MILYRALYDTFFSFFSSRIALLYKELILNYIHGKPKQLVVTLTARLPKCVRVCSRILCIYLGGLSSTINGRTLCLWQYSKLCPIASLYISKELRGYGDRSGPKIIDFGTAVRKLLRFPQVQIERERTIGIENNKFPCQTTLVVH